MQSLPDSNLAALYYGMLRELILTCAFILAAYIMHCGTLRGWTPVERTNVKKALINKCRMRAAKAFGI